MTNSQLYPAFLRATFLSRFLIASLAILCARNAPAEVALKYHCAGLSQLATNTHLTALQRVFALPSTTNFENLACKRLSLLVVSKLHLKTNPASETPIAPLISDVLQNESFGSVGSENDPTAFFLGVHIDTARSQFWQNNLTKALGAGEPITDQGFNGRRWNDLWMIPAGDWIIIGKGEAFSNSRGDCLNHVQTEKRPVAVLDHDWLEGEVNSSMLGGWFHFLKPAHCKLAVTPDDSNLRIDGTVTEINDVSWKPNPWQIPKKLMRGQIISFTVGQDVAAYLNKNSSLSGLVANPLTNQFYCWAVDQMPLLNFMAWPVPDASNALSKLLVDAPAAFNPDLKRFNGTELVPHGGSLVLQNARLFAPVLNAMQISNAEFLFLSSFPMVHGQPVSEQLLNQIQGRTNLVYYDWELTGPRLSEWQILRGMISNRSLSKEKDAADNAFIETEWLSGLTSLGGNTVTEVTYAAPREFSLIRRGPVGLTALELTILADWICDANSGPIHSPQPEGNGMPIPIRR